MRDRRHASADPLIAARTGDDDGTGVPEAIESGRREMDAVHHEASALQVSDTGEVLDRIASRRLPLGVPRSEILEQRPKRAAAGHEELELVRRFGQVHGKRRAPVRSRDGPKERRRHRVRRVRDHGRACGPVGKRVGFRPLEK